MPKGPINNIPALVQIMAWPRPGDKPLSEKFHKLDQISLKSYLAPEGHLNIKMLSYKYIAIE